MIIKVAQNQDWENSKKITWKHKFIYEITKMNNQKIQFQQKKHQRLIKFRNRGCFQFNKILNNSNIEQKFNQIQPSLAHSFCSNYIPIASHYRFDDQLTETFPYLRYLEENCNISQKIQYYEEITVLIKQGQDCGNVIQKWQQCFQMFLPQINVLKAIELYLDLLKYGTSIYDQLYQQYGGTCKKRVFLHRILQAARYFRPEIKIRKQLTLSIGSNQEVNQISIAKTSKNLFCSICLLYDCGLHKMHQDVATKDFAYINLRNVKLQSQHIIRTIKLCRMHSFLVSIQNNEQQTEYFESRQLRDFCCEFCYKKLTKQLFQGLNLQRTQLISPLIKALIKIGVQMFSFDPCNISKLFGLKKNQHRGVTCQLIFLYLTEQFNLKKKIERKFFQDEQSMLRAEKVLQSSTTQVYIHRQTKNPKRKKISRQVKAQGNLIATCFHHFIGSQSNSNCTSSQCTCYERGFCLPQCNCSPNCPIMRNGCNCRNSKDQCRNRKCPCYVMKSQCEPGRCMNCFQCLEKGIVKKNSCYNDQILRYQNKLIRIGPSKIPGAGLGAFAGQFIEMDSLVAVYTGQIIEHQIDVIRQTLSRDLSFYNFGSPNGTIDARYMGNKSRFINHGNAGQDNVRAVIMFSQGRDIVSFYADRDIEKDQQLLFDYDGQGDLYKNFHEKYPFIKKKKK